MVTSSGPSSGSSLNLQNSGSEDLNQIMDQRKRKRMVSNRESARGSRMKKQKHLDDLVAQVAQLEKDNNEILTIVNITTKLCNNLEAENLVHRAQMAELSNRLQSLNDIIDFINSSSVQLLDQSVDHESFISNNPWNFTLLHVNQPIMACVPDDVFLY